MGKTAPGSMQVGRNSHFVGISHGGHNCIRNMSNQPMLSLWKHQAPAVVPATLVILGGSGDLVSRSTMEIRGFIM